MECIAVKTNETECNIKHPVLDPASTFLPPMDLMIVHCAGTFPLPSLLPSSRLLRSYTAYRPGLLCPCSCMNKHLAQYLILTPW